MANYLGKKYKLVSSENFDEYMKALGVNIIMRKIGNHTTSCIELLKNDDGSYTLRVTSTFKNHDYIFRCGEPFDETTPDGRKVKTTMTVEGNRLIQVQKGEIDTTIDRVFSETEI